MEQTSDHRAGGTGEGPEWAALTPPPGGVMTREVGAVTGDLEVRVVDDLAQVRYAGAEDVYTVTGEAAGRTTAAAVEALRFDPGTDDTGNPLAVTLDSQRGLTGI